MEKTLRDIGETLLRIITLFYIKKDFPCNVFREGGMDVIMRKHDYTRTN